MNLMLISGNRHYHPRSKQSPGRGGRSSVKAVGSRITHNRYEVGVVEEKLSDMEEDFIGLVMNLNINRSVK